MVLVQEILSRYGVSIRSLANIDSHRDEEGRYHVKFSGSGDPALMMEPIQTTKLVAELEAIATDSGEFALARDVSGRIFAAVEDAKQFQNSRHY
jgi:hypothetical protein